MSLECSLITVHNNYFLSRLNDFFLLSIFQSIRVADIKTSNQSPSRDVVFKHLGLEAQGLVLHICV